MEDKQIHNLIDLAILDEVTKEMYHEALPKMTGEEKVAFTSELWAILMAKLQDRMSHRIEQKILEAASQGEVYDPSATEVIYQDVLQEFMQERLDVSDENELDDLREQLEMLKTEEGIELEVDTEDIE